MKSTTNIRVSILALAASSFLLAMPLKSVSAASAYQNLVWADEFNSGAMPDPAKWSYELGGGGWGNNELQTYTSNSSNVNVSNGTLNIIARETKTKRKTEITSAKLNTKNKLNLQNGRIDIRAKLPTGVGSWPAFWMLPSGAKYGTQYLANGEIDFMEEVGADQNEIVMSAHSLLYNPANSNVRYKTAMILDANTAYHTYTLDWNPEYLSYQIDGIERYRVANDHTGYESWPYDQPFYLIMNLAVGGSWGGYKGVDKTSMPWNLNIDYVRVYK